MGTPHFMRQQALSKNLSCALADRCTVNPGILNNFLKILSDQVDTLSQQLV